MTDSRSQRRLGLLALAVTLFSGLAPAQRDPLNDPRLRNRLNRPDFTPSSLSAPWRLMPGTNRAWVTVRNIGQRAGSCVATLVLSKDSRITLADRKLGSVSMRSIGIGASSKGSISFRLPYAPGMTSGYLGVVVQGGLEISLSNNVRSRSVRIDLPDFAVTNIRPIPTAHPRISKTAIYFNAINRGVATPALHVVEFVLDTRGKLPVPHVVLGRLTTSQLQRRVSLRRAAEIDLPRSLPAGKYDLIIRVDPDHAVAEAVESNDFRYQITMRPYQRGFHAEYLPYRGSIAKNHARIETKNGQAGIAFIRLFAPEHVGQTYILLWSCQSPWRYDPCSMAMRAAVNNANFVGWLGKLDATGRADAQFRQTPSLVIPNPVYTKALFYDTPSGRYLGGSGSLRTDVK